MTSLRRILKLLLAFATGQGVSIFTQLLIPPLFLHRFANGIAVYGEWITLSAAVSYLGSLNFGVQTYAVNQMTIHLNRGEPEECRTVQASALRLLQWMGLAILPLAALIAALPVANWLHLRHVDNSQARLVLELFLLQLLSMMIFSLLANGFMAVGRAHHGANWNNALRLSSTLALGVQVWMRASFAAMAASQLAMTVLCTILVIVDLQRTAPAIAPSLRYARSDVARQMVKPSWHFTVLSLSGFLIWQAPVLLMQRILGPSVVGVVALTRTVFTMSRQALAVASFSIGPEITSLVGRKDWKGLKRLYDLSERIVLLLVPTVTVATLLASPWLLAIWLHRRSFYEPRLCFLMALTSAAMGVRDHKYQFQSSSNQHEALSRVLFLAYGGVLAASAVTMRYFGVEGFMYAWLAAEIAQTVAILNMNRKLFPAGDGVNVGPIWRLVAVMALVFAGAAYPAFHAMQQSLIVVVVVAAVYSMATALVCYKVFGVSEVAKVVLRRWQVRATAAPVVP
jgi:O-antigen/teichoic acid export membrane protein